MSTFVPTNVWSITDGQILLKPELFYAGVRPAMDVGASVSRVGSKAQSKAMKSVASTLRVDLSRYSEVRAFAQFGASDLDAGTRNLLNRGEKLTEILKQPQFAPMADEEQVAVLCAASRIDELPTVDVVRFGQELLEYLRGQHAEILTDIRTAGELSDDLRVKLEAAVDRFKGVFKPSE